MATTRKKLSPAKARAAADAIAVLLDGTDHDARLSRVNRLLFLDALDTARGLARGLELEDR